jgi:membrane associated rhomboid family serine protease
MLPLKDDVPSTGRPLVTVGLIVFNVLIFFYEVSQGEYFNHFLFKMGAIPFEITHGVELTPELSFPVPLTLFSSMFLHGGLFHLGGNMLYLWIFGDNVEDKLGHVKFFIFYILCGLAASLTHILTDPNSKVPMVGASGAIAGVLGAYLLKFPGARIWTLIFFGFFIRLVKIPALFVLGFWFILQVLYGLPTLGTDASGGVAWFAHIGGFVAGMLLLKIFGLFQRT